MIGGAEVAGEEASWGNIRTSGWSDVKDKINYVTQQWCRKDSLTCPGASRGKGGLENGSRKIFLGKFKIMMRLFLVSGTAWIPLNMGSMWKHWVGIFLKRLLRSFKAIILDSSPIFKCSLPFMWNCLSLTLIIWSVKIIKLFSLEYWENVKGTVCSAFQILQNVSV